MSAPRSTNMSARDYHERTKHHLHRYAASPETLDWTAQPNPFREFSGSERIALPLCADALTARFSQLHETPGAIVPQPVTLPALGQLLELSFGLSAWKEYGPDRWALRCNPSSGNLHPTEAYVLCSSVPGLDNGVYHYVSREHALEKRCRALPTPYFPAEATVWIGLSSIHWREAWKYGERAFRYCQLDIGHALGALRYAAAALGWQVRWVRSCNSATLAQLLGLERTADFVGAEREEPDALLALIPDPHCRGEKKLPFIGNSAGHRWYGRANVLDSRPMYRWPMIDDVARATINIDNTATADCNSMPPLPALHHARDAAAVGLIKQRRSAQQFDAKHVMPAADFFHVLDSLLPRMDTPWDSWDFAARVHPVLFVHRIEGIAPGLYVLPRHPAAKEMLQAALKNDFNWTRVAHCPEHIPLYRLAAADCTRLARTLHCHQAIAATSCFALGMLAEFEPLVSEHPWRYRQLHWEAGLIGHVLYLEAEKIGLRGTGIGCFFDDAFHELLGLTDRRFQSLYHFTVGRALVDERITTLPPYPQHATPNTEDAP